MFCLIVAAPKYIAFCNFSGHPVKQNCSKVLPLHGAELWMPDFLIIKWQIFWPICVLMKFDHISLGQNWVSRNTKHNSILNILLSFLLYNMSFPKTFLGLTQIIRFSLFSGNLSWPFKRMELKSNLNGRIFVICLLDKLWYLNFLFEKTSPPLPEFLGNVSKIYGKCA